MSTVWSQSAGVNVPYATGVHVGTSVVNAPLVSAFRVESAAAVMSSPSQNMMSASGTSSSDWKSCTSPL